MLKRYFGAGHHVRLCGKKNWVPTNFTWINHLNGYGPTRFGEKCVFSSARCITLTGVKRYHSLASLPHRKTCLKLKAVKCDIGCRSASFQARSRTYYYDLLNVTPKSTQAEIKAAYYRLSKMHHPDINRKDGAKEKFGQISEAYEILGNVKKRRLYDQGIVTRGSTAAAEDDYTKPFREQEGFGTKRRAPPTGRTAMYNFDEFYRQHYGESLRQEKRDRRHWQKIQEEKESDKMFLRVRFTLTAVIVSCMLGLMYRSQQQTSMRKPPMRKK